MRKTSSAFIYTALENNTSVRVLLLIIGTRGRVVVLDIETKYIFGTISAEKVDKR